jgi:succinoglycan biosynthesis transport protein ExoP
MTAHAGLQPTPVHPALKEVPSVRKLLEALRRRWVPALVVGMLLAAIVAATLWFVLPPAKHTVRSLIHMAAVTPSVLFTTKDGYSFDMYQRSQTALVKSRFVLNTALGQKEVKNLKLVLELPDPVQWLERELRVDFSLGPEILRISMEGNDPDQLKILVNGVTRAYLDEIGNKEHNSRLERLDFLKNLHRKYDDKIQTRKQNLRELSEVAETGNAQHLIFKQGWAIQELGQARNELVGLQSKIRKLQVDITMLRGGEIEHGPESLALLCGCCVPRAGSPVHLALAGLLQPKRRPDLTVSDKTIADVLNKDPVIERESRNLKGIENMIRAHQSVNPPGASQGPLLGYQADLIAARKAIEDRRNKLLPQVREEAIARNKLNNRARLYQLEQEVASLKELEKVLRGEVDQLSKSNRFLTKAGLQLDDIKDDIARGEVIAATMSREIDTLEVEKQAKPRMNLLEEAVSYAPDGAARQFMMAGMGGLGALAMVLFAFAWLEFHSRKVNSADEMVHGLGIKLIGTMPDFGYRPRRWWTQNGASSVYWDNLLVDSVDAVRTAMLFAARTARIQTVMITSATAGEGKTFSATQLAASLARSGRKTLLIDCDLRNPNAHRLFDVPRQPGLSEALCDEMEAAPIIHATNVQGLSVLAGGSANAQAVQALSHDKLAMILERFRQQFDFLVIDSSPILPVPDALVIAQQVDAVIFSVLRGVSRTPNVYAAYQKLALLGTPILGALVNGVRHDGYSGDKYPYGGQPEESPEENPEKSPEKSPEES